MNSRIPAPRHAAVPATWHGHERRPAPAADDAAAQLRRLRRELGAAERVAGELEKLALDAVHDLRAPLQTIAGYVHLVTVYEGGALDERSQGCLHAIMATVGDMSALIEASFEYVRTSSAPYRLGPVDGHALVQRVISLIDGDVDEHDAVVVEVDDLPQLVGDEVELTRLFANLLRNRVQASTTHDRPRVTVSSRPAAGSWEIVVTDNGSGVPASDRERIFEPFQRSEARGAGDVSRGAGMGLAVARRVAERHGGSLRAEDAPGGGTSFVVSLPDA